MKDSNKKPKIVKIEKSAEEKPIILNEKQEELKKKLIEIDNKVEEIEAVVGSIFNENNETVFCDDVVVNVIGYAALSAATKIIGEYFGIDDLGLDDL